MDLEMFIESFKVFNANGINNLVYAFSANWWLFLIVIGAVATTVMSVTSKIGTVVREEQNVL